MIFYICAGIIIGGTLFYLLVADGEVQKWAMPKTDKQEEEAISMLENNNKKQPIDNLNNNV